MKPSVTPGKTWPTFPQVVVLADEVYENLVYEGSVHTRIATLPGMWEKTLTLSSAGKTFSVTGTFSREERAGREFGIEGLEGFGCADGVIWCWREVEAVSRLEIGRRRCDSSDKL